MTRYWLVAGGILTFFLLLFLAMEALALPSGEARGWLERGGIATAATGVALLVADLLIPVPSSLIMVAFGAIFGVWQGALLSLLGSTGAALVGFAVGRAGGPLLARLVPAPEQARADAMLRRWGLLAIVASRPVPLLAETVIVLAGASPLGWRRAILAAAVGSLPPALLYAVAGGALMDSGGGVTAVVFMTTLFMSGVLWAVGRRLEPRRPLEAPKEAAD